MIKVERLFNIDQKFKRYSGWSGADGIFLNDYNGEILMYFSDTFIGKSNSDDKRTNFELINNSLAISDENLNNINFIYNTNPIQSVFKNNEYYYWLEYSIIEDDKQYIYALRMYNDIFSNEIFEIKGVDLIELNLPYDKEVYYKTKCVFNYSDDLIVLGTSIIKEGDYYYIYGYINEYNNKKLILTRSKSLDLVDLEYLNKDKKFSKSKDNLLVLKEHFSSEFKVVKIKDLYYIAYTKNSIGKDIYLLIIDDLFSFYNKEIHLYECNEHRGSIICYNAKIQPSLSNEDALVVTYNVNTLVNDEHVNLDIYRPRFIKVKMEDVNNEVKKFY